MKKYEDKVVLIIDNGLYVNVALKMSESFGTTLYYTPWISSFPNSNDTLVGSGFPNIERINDLFSYIDKVDLFVFTDVFSSDLQIYLQSIGKRVWGARSGDSMEINRYEFILKMKELGLETPVTDLIIGMDNLRLFLEENENKFVKVDSQYRGDVETFQHINYDITKPLLDKLSYKMGPRSNSIRFIVQDPIDAVCETGYDGYCIDGIFPDVCLFGIECKDKGYIGEIRSYNDIPKQIKEINDKLIPLFKEYGYRGMISTEIRITENGTPYLIDMTCRFPSPPTSTMLELIENLVEIIYEGANGIMIQPIFKARYGAEVIGTSDYARENFMQIFCDGVKGIYMPNSCMIDGCIYTIPAKYDDMNMCCNVASVGNTVEEVIKDLEEKCSEIKGIGLCLDPEILNEAIDQLSKL